MSNSTFQVQLPVSNVPISRLFLQSGASYMWRWTNITMGIRLALVDKSALIFESARAKRGGGGAAACMSVRLPLDPTLDVTVREVPLDNTLLASAVRAFMWGGGLFGGWGGMQGIGFT